MTMSSWGPLFVVKGKLWKVKERLIVEVSAETGVANAMSADGRHEMISEPHGAMYMSMIDA